MLFRAVSKDPKDTCREIALSTLVIVSGEKTLNDETFLKNDSSSDTAMGKKPFLEDSEELRLLLLKLLNNLLSSHHVKVLFRSFWTIFAPYCVLRYVSSSNRSIK